ncbi:hypothetical protein [Streptomyces sp. NPDC127092]|uniref:hypothetical protein n=1 Tax=Streptomyces sp. NPDC127092 TaxID=3347135 RepID=UPI003653F314
MADQNAPADGPTAADGPGLHGLHFSGEPVAAWAVGAGENAFASLARASLLRDYARWGFTGTPATHHETSEEADLPGTAA